MEQRSVSSSSPSSSPGELKPTSRSTWPNSARREGGLEAGGLAYMGPAVRVFPERLCAIRYAVLQTPAGPGGQGGTVGAAVIRRQYEGRSKPEDTGERQGMAG